MRKISALNAMHLARVQATNVRKKNSLFGIGTGEYCLLSAAPNQKPSIIFLAHGIALDLYTAQVSWIGVSQN
jgi:hypothetical protein